MSGASSKMMLLLTRYIAGWLMFAAKTAASASMKLVQVRYTPLPVAFASSLRNGAKMRYPIAAVPSIAPIIV